MKKRLFAALLVLCLTVGLVPPEASAEDLSGFLDIMAEIEKTPDGGIITLTGTAAAATSTVFQDTPWIIDKNVTIEGNGNRILVRRGGILLGGNVTFRNVDLDLTQNIRNCIIANGYSLTLDNVKATNLSFNVVGGTLYPADYEVNEFTIPAPGRAAEIRLLNGTNLQRTPAYGSGNVYAGDLRMGPLNATDPPSTATNVFSGDVAIHIQNMGNDSAALGTVYACGAENRIPPNASGGKETVPDPDKYTVSGKVTVEGETPPHVAGAGSNRTEIVYRGGGNQAARTYTDISSLTVEAGNLSLNAGSSFRDEKAVTLSSGAKLNLTNYASDTGSFSGSGGYLILGQNQTLNISGQVSGSTKVAIGSLNVNMVSGTMAIENHTYIKAPGSSDGAFELLPYATQANMKLVKDANGNWNAQTEGGSGTEELVNTFEILTKTNSVAAGEEAEFGLNAERADGNYKYLDHIPLTIYVGQTLLNPKDEGDYYSYADRLYDFSAKVMDNALLISSSAKGTYEISITVPSNYTVDKKLLNDKATLTVTGGDPGAPVTIPIPQAVPNLKWTGKEQTGVPEGTGYTLTGHQKTNVGSYTATASLQDGYQWTGGVTADQTIPWSIGKADGPAAPAGLGAKAPSASGKTDGIITGTTTLMEYASHSAFTGAQDCGAVETQNLAPGTYYVRLKETDTHLPGAAASITVPAYGAPTVTKIAIKTPASKLEYRIGETLDVTGLTLEVTCSDQSVRTVPVTADMVSGFRSDRAVESLPLTITYEGKTASYTVKILESETPGNPKYEVTVNNSYASLSGAGFYEAGDTVTVRAGTYSGYRFASWSPSGVELADRKSPEIRFTMPANDVTLLAVWQPDDTAPPTGHSHVWSGGWSSSGTYHWHNCTASGCPITSDSEKSGYAAHTPGSWVTDQPATSTQPGSRHKACTVCGRILETGTIPATGGSSGGGSSSDRDDPSNGDTIVSGPPVFNGGSSSGTVKNPDGSTTTTVTDKATGTVTETTRRPDGSKTVTETKKDGTVTVTETAKDGSFVKTRTRPDGSSETGVQDTSGSAGVVRREPGGAVEAEVRLSAKATGSGESVDLPLPPLSAREEPLLTIRTGSKRLIRVEIPLSSGGPGTVAYTVDPSGRETLLKTALADGGRLCLTVSDGTEVRLRERGVSFADTQGHWAADAVTFVTARELFAGRTASAFDPDAPMTRAMLATVLARLDGTDTSGGATAYERGVAWAVSRGISDGSNLDGQVTREQLVTMLYRYAGSPAAAGSLNFQDGASISGYAREAVRWAVENGILSGYAGGSLYPGKPTTRAQTAAILMRYVALLGA